MPTDAIENSCIDYSAFDLTQGIPVDALSSAVRTADADGDGVIRGFRELQLLNALTGSTCWAAGTPLWSPRIIRQTHDPRRFLISYQGTTMNVVVLVESSEEILRQVALAIQFIPRQQKKEVAKRLNPSVVIGARPDLIRYYETEPTGNEDIAQALRENDIPAFTYRYVDAKDPKENETQIIINTLLTDRKVLIANAKTYGCSRDSLFLDGLFHTVLHEFSHAADGAIAQKLGLESSFSGQEWSPPSRIIDEAQEAGQACIPRDNPSELFAEGMARYMICLHLKEEGDYPAEILLPPPRYSTTYEFPQIRPAGWRSLVAAYGVFFSVDSLEPQSFDAFKVARTP